MGQLSIHDAVAATLTEMGLCHAPATLVRTILIRDGYFLGEKYRFDGGYVISLAGKNAIDVYDGGGNVLKTVSLEMNGEEKAA